MNDPQVSDLQKRLDLPPAFLPEAAGSQVKTRAPVSLPPELWGNIFEHVSLSSFPALRAASPVFAEILRQPGTYAGSYLRIVHSLPQRPPPGALKAIQALVSLRCGPEALASALKQDPLALGHVFEELRATIKAKDLRNVSNFTPIFQSLIPILSPKECEDLLFLMLDESILETFVHKLEKPIYRRFLHHLTSLTIRCTPIPADAILQVLKIWTHDNRAYRSDLYCLTASSLVSVLAPRLNGFQAEQALALLIKLAPSAHFRFLSSSIAPAVAQLFERLDETQVQKYLIKITNIGSPRAKDWLLAYAAAGRPPSSSHASTLNFFEHVSEVSKDDQAVIKIALFAALVEKMPSRLLDELWTIALQDDALGAMSLFYGYDVPNSWQTLVKRTNNLALRQKVAAMIQSTLCQQKGFHRVANALNALGFALTFLSDDQKDNVRELLKPFFSSSRWHRRHFIYRNLRPLKLGMWKARLQLRPINYVRSLATSRLILKAWTLLATSGPDPAESCDVAWIYICRLVTEFTKIHRDHYNDALSTLARHLTLSSVNSYTTIALQKIVSLVNASVSAKDERALMLAHDVLCALAPKMSQPYLSLIVSQIIEKAANVPLMHNNQNILSLATLAIFLRRENQKDIFDFIEAKVRHSADEANPHKKSVVLLDRDGQHFLFGKNKQGYLELLPHPAYVRSDLVFVVRPEISSLRYFEDAFSEQITQ